MCRHSRLRRLRRSANQRGICASGSTAYFCISSAQVNRIVSDRNRAIDLIGGSSLALRWRLGINMSTVPDIRIQACNSVSVRPDRDYVLYWMIAFRRVEWNFSLQHAVEWATKLRKPLVIFEPLRVGYPWAS